MTGKPDIRALGAFFALMYFIQSLGDPGTGIVAQPIRSMLSDWNLGPGDIALFMALIGLPWTLKPLFGLASDFIPIRGSKRKLYLILSSAGAALGFGLVAGLPILAGDFWLLLTILMLPAIGVAFGDVLIDAVMIDEGQPTGLTGVLQSIQWTAAYAGLLLTGLIGGYFSEIGRPDLAFGGCALLWSASLALAIFVVKDPVVDHEESLKETMASLLSSARRPGLISVGVILFIWNFNPLWTTVLYLHFIDTLGFDEMTFGQTYSVFSLGGMLGAMAYPFYCRRIHLGPLIHICIASGVVANVLYFFVFDIATAYVVAVFAGFAYMTGTMIQMDLAARRVPLLAAATVFALMMALSNFSTSISEAFGGQIYEGLMSQDDRFFAYNVVVAISAFVPALCWWIVPRIKREMPDWFSHGPVK